VWWRDEITRHTWLPHASPIPCCYLFGSEGITDFNRSVNVAPSNYALQVPFGSFHIQVIHVWWNWKPPVAKALYLHLYSLPKHYKYVLVTLSLPVRTFSLPSLSVMLRLITVPNTCQMNTLRNKSDYLCIMPQWFHHWLFLASAWHVLF